jgi:hypothetical protein
MNQYLSENRINLQNTAGCNTAYGRMQIACNDVFCFKTLLGELTES